GKTLLAPGMRVGYVALPPTMTDREQVRGALGLSIIALGWAYPNALVQHALPEFEDLSIDLAHLERKRDRMVAGLREAGYTLHVPEGAFYLLPASPWRDDEAFTDLLASKDVFVLPGRMVEWPGHFRISITANDDMIDRALPRFAEALAEARAAPVPS
ncbi:MAG TPA: aminotransferase class I/II-fold pyridoxal phosphate-dependent enzyme, partial [Actinomycetota bacterium]|nr:aminotransferase class I/II-fold pyridoxal phosphate-dependent enzyme [Actinomycetota bacterium]